MPLPLECLTVISLASLPLRRVLSLLRCLHKLCLVRVYLHDWLLYTAVALLGKLHWWRHPPLSTTSPAAWLFEPTSQGWKISLLHAEALLHGRL